MAVNGQRIFDHSETNVNNLLNISVNSIHVPQYNLGNQNSYMFNAQWPNVPPTNINWGVPNANLPNVVRFTGLPNVTVSTTNYFQEHAHGTIPIKRKSQDEEMDEHPQKMLITEDKMAAKMRNMRISSDYAYKDLEQDYKSVNISDNDDEEVANKHPQLYMCDELQQMERIPSTIVPRPLISNNSTSNALVLWRPPMTPPYNCEYNDRESTKSSVTITDITDLFKDENTNTIIPLPYEQLHASNNMDAMEM